MKGQRISPRLNDFPGETGKCRENSLHMNKSLETKVFYRKQFSVRCVSLRFSIYRNLNTRLEMIFFVYKSKAVDLMQTYLSLLLHVY